MKKLSLVISSSGKDSSKGYMTLTDEDGNRVVCGNISMNVDVRLKNINTETHRVLMGIPLESKEELPTNALSRDVYILERIYIDIFLAEITANKKLEIIAKELNMPLPLLKRGKYCNFPVLNDCTLEQAIKASFRLPDETGNDKDDEELLRCFKTILTLKLEEMEKAEAVKINV